MMDRQGSVATAPYYHNHHLHHHHHQQQQQQQHAHHLQHYQEQATALAYCPTVPLSVLQQQQQQQHQHPHQHSHHAQQQASGLAGQQTQLSLVPAGAIYPHFGHHHHSSTLPHRTRHPLRAEALQHTMASEPSHAMSDEELAAFQQASESYEAPITVRSSPVPRVRSRCCSRHLGLRRGSTRTLVVDGQHPTQGPQCANKNDFYQGPLVGQRQPSTALTSEYASADPVYQAKTQVRSNPDTKTRSCTSNRRKKPPRPHQSDHVYVLGAAAEILPLPNRARRWQVRMERYVRQQMAVTTRTGAKEPSI